MSHARETIELAGTPITYTDQGTGPPLVLLHGAPTTSFVYRHLIGHLQAHFRCISFDFPGWGDSPAHPGSTATLPELADVTERLLCALGLQGVVLKAMDTAGAPGLRVAQRAPDLVRGLVLADTFVYPSSEYPLVRWMLRFVTGRFSAAVNRRFNLLPRLVSRFGGRGRTLSADEKSAYDRAFSDRRSRDRVLAPLRDLLENEPFLRSVRDGLPKMDLPVLLLFGEHDPMRRVGVQDRLARELARPSTATIPGEAHFPQEGHPGAVAEAILAWARETGLLTESG